MNLERYISNFTFFKNLFFLKAHLLKKIVLPFLFIFVFANNAKSQSIADYTFASTSTTFTALSSPADPAGTGTTDEGIYNAIPIGFDFWYMGTRYTTVSASTNGWLTLGANITAATPTNNLTSGGTPRPIIAPLWDNLDIVSGPNVSYLTTGTAGGKIFTLQYLNVKWGTGAYGATISFQVKLYETTGKIEFIYRSETGSVSSPSASIGIAASATGSGNFRSLNGTGSTPTASSTFETSNLSTKPTSGRVYSFTSATPTAPTSLSFTNVTSTTITLNWTDLASTDNGYAIYRSTDGVNYTYVTKTATSATSSVQSGLSENTIYYWKVYALTEGALSTALSGSRATACVTPTISGSATAACTGSNTGTITGSASGGSTPYTYSLNSGTYQTSSSFSGLAAGTYTLTVKSNTGCTASTSVTVLAGLGNNQLDYTKGAHGVLCATSDEGGTTTLTAPAGSVFSTVNFASYGNPTGTCSLFVVGSCNAATSETVASSYLLGNNTAGIPVTNTVFGDPCSGTAKRFYVQATYTQPICVGTSPGTITGATPTGGNGTYTYLWEVSTTSATAGFTTATGTSNAKDYTPGVLTQTTWYRRTVTSGGCSDVSNPLQVTVSALPGATISYGTNPLCIGAGTATVNRNGTAGGTYTSTAGLTINSSTGDITLSTSTANTYTVTYTMVNGTCTTTATTSVTVTAQPSGTFSYAGSPYCGTSGTASVTKSATFTAGGVYTAAAGLSINAATGDVNIAASDAGVYTVTYTVASLGTCPLYSTTANITITAPPYATGSYPGNPFCQNGGYAIPTGSVSAPGIISSTAGLSINTSNGLVNLAASTPGTYDVTYTIAASGGCPVFATSYPITITAAPYGTISYSGSPFCPSSSTVTVTRNATAGGTYSSTAGLSINSTTGDIDLSASTEGTYTVTYTVAAASGCSAYTTTTPVSITAASWTGAVSNIWFIKENWSCNSVPSKSTNVIIPSGLSRYPTISTIAAVNNITVQSGASLTINSTLQISGSIANSGTINATAATINMVGTAAQVIPAAAFATNTVNDLTVNNTAGVTLAGALDVTDLLTITTGTLTSNGYLTLKSSATNTARIAQITSSATTPIIGNVTVERYIPGRRKYRLVTSSVTTSTSSVLTSAQAAQSIWGNWQNQGVATAGVGTLITGGTAADGFDTQTTSSSLFTYNALTKKFVAFSSASGKNTKFTPLTAGVGYYMFVYGDRLNSISASSPHNTILRETGTLLTGNQYYSTTTPIAISNVPLNYTLIGNPYASIIDWKKVQLTNVSKTIWGWDPNLGSTGGYVTVNTANLLALISPVSNLIKVSQYVQPGQAFFVQTLLPSPTITIQESAKLTEAAYVNNNVFRTDSAATVQPLIAVNLLYNNAGVDALADGAIAAFDPSFSNDVNEGDGVKMLPSTEGISIVHGSDLLSIDARRNFVNNDTMFLSLSNLTKAQYTLEIFGSNTTVGNVIPYLEDNYLHTSKALSQVDTNRIVFNVVTGDAASYNANRFRIVFKELSVLPVTFTAIKATEKGNNIQVDWNVAQESGIEKYQVEYSTDGATFSKKAEVTSRGTSIVQSYTWLDVNTSAGNNFYRIRAMQADGKNFLSKTEVVKLNTLKSQIKVFPNPVTNQQLNLQLDAIEKGQYTLVVRNSQAQQITKLTINHLGGTSTQVITFSKKLPRGIYYLSVINNNNKFEQAIFIE